MNKTINEIIFYCQVLKPQIAQEYNGKPLYPTWPKLLHHPSETAIQWADGWPSQDYFTVTMPNFFENAIVLNTISSRYRNAKVPQAVVYCEEKDCYLQFDFRSDALVETLIEGRIEHGVITEPMSFRFSSNYYFVPTNGTSFKEFKKSFIQSNKPKTNQSTKIDIGVPFVGSYDRVYRYLGEFECVRDDGYNPDGGTGERLNYANQKVHVYHECQKNKWRTVREEEDLQESEAPNFCISKSKMNVKSLELPKDAELFDIEFSGTMYSNRGSKGGYGSGWLVETVVDFNDRTVKYIKKPPVNNFRGCGFPYFR